MGYDRLLTVAESHGLYVYETTFESRSKGMIKGGIIGIDQGLTYVEKTCALAEETGHYYTASGDILDQSNPYNRKQERRGREWGYNYLIPLQRIIEAHQANAKGRHEIAEYIGVTDKYLQDAINRYTDKYGLCVIVDEQYTILFDPLAVVDRFV